MAKRKGNRGGRRPPRAAPGRDESGAELKSDELEVEGVVTEQLRNAQFVVELANGHKVLAHTAGKMRRFRIRIMPGDRVVVALSPYDLDRGRITYRHRN